MHLTENKGDTLQKKRSQKIAATISKEKKSPKENFAANVI
jgi:hypothetical protein